MKDVWSTIYPSRASSHERMNLSITRKHCNGATKPCNEHCLQNNAFPSRNSARNVWEMCGLIPQIWNQLWISPNRSLKWRKPSSSEKLAQEPGFQSLPLLHPATLHNLWKKMCWWRWTKLGLKTWCIMMNEKSPNEAPQRKEVGFPPGNTQC